MGSEQSSQLSKPVRAGLRRGKSVPEYQTEENLQENEQADTINTYSPEPSVCSDSELPYISYTVNRPIGDSPNKKLTRKLSRGRCVTNVTAKRFKTSASPFSSTARNIVVVKKTIPPPSKSNDLELIKLQSLPMFLPIIRGAISAPSVRDPEILERLNSTPLCNLCHLYQNTLNKSSVEVCSKQDKLMKQVVQIDKKAISVMHLFTERQKNYAKYAEKCSKIADLVKQVEKCNTILKDTVILIQSANDALPDDLKLEPFAWTTG